MDFTAQLFQYSLSKIEELESKKVGKLDEKTLKSLYNKITENKLNTITVNSTSLNNSGIADLKKPVSKNFRNSTLLPIPIRDNWVIFYGHAVGCIKVKLYSNSIRLAGFLK